MDPDIIDYIHYIFDCSYWISNMADGTPLSLFNLIDVFGYVIPGTLLLVGLMVPVEIDFESLNILISFTLIVILAFVVGMAIPALEELLGPVRLGEWLTRSYQPDHGFVNDIFQAQEQSPENSEEGTNYKTKEYFDYEVYKLCQDRFSLDGNLSRPGYYSLWLAVLSYLETTPHVRTYRLQALYTFSNNISIVFDILLIYYVVLAALKTVDQIGGTAFEVGTSLIPVRSLPFLFGLLIVATASSYVFARQSTFFLSRWHFYSKMEFYMDQKMND